jgi:hypothetical protein
MSKEEQLFRDAVADDESQASRVGLCYLLNDAQNDYGIKLFAYHSCLLGVQPTNVTRMASQCANGFCRS